MGAPLDITDFQWWDRVLTIIENHGMSTLLVVYFIVRMDGLMGRVRDLLGSVHSTLEKLVEVEQQELNVLYPLAQRNAPQMRLHDASTTKP